MMSDESQDPEISAEAGAPENATDGSAGPPAFAPEAKTGETQGSAVGRKLAPPPKPSRDSRPSYPPNESSSAPAMRSPMIVLGETTPPVPREGAQAWNRPASEPPRPGMAWGNLGGTRREPTSSVGALRSRLEAREKTNTSPPRERVGTTPSGAPVTFTPAAALPVPPPPPPPPAPTIATPVPTRAASSPEIASPAPRDGAKPDGAAGLAPQVVQSLPSVELGKLPVDLVAPGRGSAPDLRGSSPDLRASAPEIGARPEALPPPIEAKAEVAPPAREAPPVREAPSRPRAETAPVVQARSRAPVPVPAAPPAAQSEAAAASSESQAIPPRPKSSPARLRSGPPRPRASSPGFHAARPGSPPPPRPVPASRMDVPPAPKVPQFSNAGGVAHVAMPAASDEAAPRRSEPPVTASAIAVMKIIAVGDPSAETTIEIEEDFEETDDVETTPVSTSAAQSLEALAPMPVRPEDLEELPAEEVSTEPLERKTPIPELSSDEAIPVVEDLEAMTPAVPNSRDVDARPPPPPRRAPKTPTPPKALPQAKRRQKRPWWEDVFGEDFVRASYRLSEPQVRKEVDFIEESLGVAGGGVVLDLGCGSGHHAVELASRGYGVVGYDLSLYQLALAAEVAQERSQKLNFLQGDMREMAFEEMFDGIFCWNTSFGYFEEDKNLMVAERVFRALRPGGMFLIDVVNRDFVAAQSPGQLWYEGDSCVCMDDMSLDFITSRMRVKRSVILDDGRTRECVYSVRVYSMHELGKLLHDVGFRVTEASGHPSTPGVFFGEHSPRIIMLAQKP
jgi:SAM-dependent methyltransferase